jgi:hypothetical protein
MHYNFLSLEFPLQLIPPCLHMESKVLIILVIFTTRKIELWSDKKDLIDLRVLIR